MPQITSFDQIIPTRTTKLRLRWLDRWRGFHLRRDRFPQGDVYRVWLGWWLVTLMRPSHAQRIGW